MADLANLKIKRAPVSIAPNPAMGQGGLQAPAMPQMGGIAAPTPNPIAVPVAPPPRPLSESMAAIPMATQAYQEAGDPFTAFAQGWTNSTSAREQMAFEEAQKAQEEQTKMAERKAAADLIREQFPGQENLARGVEIGAWDAKSAMDFAKGGSSNLPSKVQEYEYYAKQERDAGRQPMSYMEYARSGSGSDAASIVSIYDDQGREQKGYMNGTEFVPIGGAKAPANESGFNVSQATAAGYADRMAQTDAILGQEALIAASTNPMQVAAGGVPLVGNWMKSPEYQQAEQAQRDFINAILRRESGAVIADSEFENARKQYFPQPGDTPEVIQQKAANRKNAINGVARAAGPAYVMPDTTNYLSNPPPESTGSPAAPDEVAQPQTQQEYDALPSGAMFVDPDDGQTYRKP